MLTIDAHQHFWRYNARDYGWISDEIGALRRDFLPSDLAGEMRRAGVDGTVAVQARQSLEETRWLLELAEANPFIRGVVGWVPLADKNSGEVLGQFSTCKKLRGVRHVLQDEPDERHMLREDFNRGVALLHARGLAYDILVFEKHLPQTIQFVDRHPQQVFVLDHLAKPRVRDNSLEPWRKHLHELARRANVYCKISGLVTEGDHQNWTPQQLSPYYEAALESFGPARLLFGSDWPVCTTACDYGRWLGIVKDWARPLSGAEQAQIFGGTAMEAYRLA